jgi:hypothetical protein
MMDECIGLWARIKSMKRQNTRMSAAFRDQTGPSGWIEYVNPEEIGYTYSHSHRV